MTREHTLGITPDVYSKIMSGCRRNSITDPTYVSYNPNGTTQDDKSSRGPSRSSSEIDLSVSRPLSG